VALGDFISADEFVLPAWCVLLFSFGIVIVE